MRDLVQLAGIPIVSRVSIEILPRDLEHQTTQAVKVFKPIHIGDWASPGLSTMRGPNRGAEHPVLTGTRGGKVGHVRC